MLATMAMQAPPLQSKRKAQQLSCAETQLAPFCCWVVVGCLCVKECFVFALFVLLFGLGFFAGKGGVCFLCLVVVAAHSKG
jgi:hypothetical protein